MSSQPTPFPRGKVAAKDIWFEISVFDQWQKLPNGIPRVTQRLFSESLENSNFRYFYYHPKLEKFVAPDHIAYFKELMSGIVKYDVTELPIGQDLVDCLIGRSDHVVLTGAGWDHSAYISNVFALSDLPSSVTLSCIIYDAIAISHPHFFTQEFGAAVCSTLKQLFQLCHHFICISQSTRNDVKKLLPPNKTTSVFRLGEDIPLHVRIQSEPRQNYILCVGTIEIRKNHLLLYFVWRKLVQRYGDQCPRLIIVGRLGWLAGDVLELLARDPLINRFVSVLTNVEDDRLVRLYESSMFTIYPSYYEGYGLPVSESLNLGRVCVCSNTASLPEINPFPELMFDPYDFAAAEKVVAALIDNPEKRTDYECRVSDTYKPQSWKKCFYEFQRALEVWELI